MAKTVIVFDPIYPSAPSTRLRLADAIADALVAAGSAVFPVLETSLATGIVTPPLLAPVNTALPVISGTAQEGQTLSCTAGTWSNSPTAYAYQWRRDGVAIAGSTFSTRLQTSADVNTVITCEVTASNLGGSSKATSAAVGPVTAASTPLPVNTVAPVVSGTGAIGQTLSTTNGTWTNSPSGYTYQWRRDGVNIAGATASTYQLVAADGGTSTTCRVTAVNAGGSAAATSNAITVAAAPVAGIAATAFPSAPAVQFHPHTATMTNFSDQPAQIGERVKTMSDKQGLANALSDDITTAPILNQDVLGRKFLNFRDGAFMYVANALVTSAQGIMVTAAVRFHKSKTATIFYPRYQSDGTTANAATCGALRSAPATGAGFPSIATSGSTSAGDAATRARTIPSCQLQVLHMACRNTVGGGTRFQKNETVAANQPQATARVGMIGGIIGAIPNGTGVTQITTTGFSLYELAIANVAATDSASDAQGNAAVSNYAIPALTSARVVAGDSIGDPIIVRSAAEGGSTSDYSPGYLMTQPGASLVPATMDVRNVSTSGNAVSNLRAEQTATISLYDQRISANDDVIFQIGRNDTSAGITASQHFQNVKDLCHKGDGTGYLERGWKVTVARNIASGNSTTESNFYGPYRASLTSSLVSDLVAISASYSGRVRVLNTDAITVGGNTVFATIANANDLTYYQPSASNINVSDITHPRPLGMTVMTTGGDTPANGYASPFQ